MGLHVQLQGGQGWLAAIKSLDPARAAEAEQDADTWVAGEFSDWDRSTWSPGSQPAEVQQAALAVASAAYLERSRIAADPEAKANKATDQLRRRAQALADRANQRARMLAPDGSWETPLDPPSNLEVNLL